MAILERPRLASKNYLGSITGGFSLEASSIRTLAKEVKVQFQQTNTTETTRSKFERAALTWETDTLMESSVNRMIVHPAYLSIIAMGTDALPFIFEHMRIQPGFWFAALEAITNENPIRQTSRGDILAMTKDWIDWAKEGGYVSRT